MNNWIIVAKSKDSRCMLMRLADSPRLWIEIDHPNRPSFREVATIEEGLEQIKFWDEPDGISPKPA